MTVTTTRHDAVTVLHLGDDENRFSPGWLDSVMPRSTRSNPASPPRW